MCKKILSGSGQLKMMFHLLTSRVSFRKNSFDPFKTLRVYGVRNAIFRARA